MKNSAAWKDELISIFNEASLSVEFVDEWENWVHRDPLVGSFSEMNLFCLQIFPTVKAICYWKPVWMVVKHFTTLQKYTGDSISSTVNECITLNFKGTEKFRSRWRPNPIGNSCCARVQLLSHVWLQLMWIRRVLSPAASHSLLWWLSPCSPSFPSDLCT